MIMHQGTIASITYYILLIQQDKPFGPGPLFYAITFISDKNEQYNIAK